jgi:hypothetical protein
MPRAMPVIDYASADDSKTAANSVYSLLSTTTDDLHAVLTRIERLRSLHKTPFFDKKISKAQDTVLAAVMDLHAAVMTSWEASNAEGDR